MIDSDGFRPNVGIIIANDRAQVLWAHRVRQQGWQFPQGGIQDQESPKDALFRELYEEVGLDREDVTVLGWTRGWLRYRLPKRFQRHSRQPACVGQKQRWYLLQLVAEESAVSVMHGHSPEFDSWRWVSYWYPLDQVVAFKREVYRRALRELAPRMPLVSE